jgi:hypothetical protein
MTVSEKCKDANLVYRYTKFEPKRLPPYHMAGIAIILIQTKNRPFA